MRKKQTSNIKKYADNYIKSRRKYIDPNELREALYGEHGIEIPVSPAVQNMSDEQLYNMSDEELEALERQLGIK